MLSSTLRPPRPTLVNAQLSPSCARMQALPVMSVETEGTSNVVLSIIEAGGTLLITAAVSSVLLTVLALVVYVWQQQYVLSLRARRFTSSSTKSRSVPEGDPAYLPPKDCWVMDELAEYDGSGCDDGPVLVAVDGLVYNVAKARNFYGPGGEYAVMGGTDATRYLARNSVEPETEEKAALALNVAERAALAAWKLSFEQKYDSLGRLATPAETEELRAAEERNRLYMERMEELSAAMEETEDARANLEASWHEQQRAEDA